MFDDWDAKTWGIGIVIYLVVLIVIWRMAYWEQIEYFRNLKLVLSIAMFFLVFGIMAVMNR